MKKRLLVSLGFCNFTGLTAGLLVLGMAGMASANMIDDNYGSGAGSFELGNFVSGGGNPHAAGSGYMGLLPGDTTMTGWTVGGPGDGVDWLTTPRFGANTGIHSVDLQHLSASSISTVIPTIAGNVYELSFSAAAWLGRTNTGVVSAGSLVNQAFTPTFSSSYQSQTFTPFSFLFTANDPTTSIQFMGIGPDTFYGPVIDSVSVESTASVPEPASMLLMGTGLVGFYVARRKKSTASRA